MNKIFSSLKGIFQYLGGCHFVYITIICSLLFAGVYMLISHIKEGLDEMKHRQGLLNDKQNLINVNRQQVDILNRQHRSLNEAAMTIENQKAIMKKLIQEIERLSRTDILKRLI